VPNSLSPELLSLGLLQYVVFLLSTTFHEASHALAAKLGGDPTAFHGGQVSLNPLPHMRREPFGMVLLPLLGIVMGGGIIGWASAPYDPNWQLRYPRRAALMSLAGPAANFMLVIVAALLMQAGLFAGVFRPATRLGITHLVDAASPGTMDGVVAFVSILFSLNLLLGMFNLLPFPPLDGFGAAGIVLPPRAAVAWVRFGYRLGLLSFLGLLLAWRLFEGLYHPALIASLRLIYPAGLYQ
jgi:Zn-dependent protease